MVIPSGSGGFLPNHQEKASESRGVAVTTDQKHLTMKSIAKS